MRLDLFKMGIEGKVAVANLTLICCTLLVLLGGEYNIHSEGWIAAGAIAKTAVAVLGFPVGWITMLGDSMDDPPVLVFILGAIFLPLNAYLWGYIVAALIKRRNHRRTPPHVIDGDANDSQRF